MGVGRRAARRLRLGADDERDELVVGFVVLVFFLFVFVRIVVG